MSLADALKERTNDMHRHAETRPLQKALVGGKATRNQLATYLAQLGHLHQTIEDLIDALPEPARAIASHSSLHSRSVARDLQTLEITPEVLPETAHLADELRYHCAQQPFFIIGALYVLEGSMNGNKYIARGLAGSLGLAPGHPGLSYWDPYGDNQRSKWIGFRTALDTITRTQTEEQAVHDGAAYMFKAVAEISDAAADAADAVSAV